MAAGRDAGRKGQVRPPLAQTGAGLAKAKDLLARGDLDRAGRECAAVLRKVPENAEANYLMGVIALRSQRTGDAAGFLEAAVKSAPGNSTYLLDLALVLDAGGRRAEARSCYQRAVSAAPRDPRALGAVVNFLVRTGETDDLMPPYREARAAGWRDFETFILIGTTFYHRFQFTEAKEVFADALGLAPANADAKRGMGMTLACLKRFADAVPFLESSVLPAPNEPLRKIQLWGQAHLLAAKAGIALEEGRWLEATRLLGESMDLLRRVLPQSISPSEAGSAAPRRVHRLLYIEIELRAREFEARVLLALHAAAQGMDVIVGQKAVINRIGFARLPAGVVLVKTMNGNDVGRIKTAHDAGHLVVVLDEEAFGGSGKRPLWMRLNTDPEALARTDAIIAQGGEYRDLLTKVFPEAASKISVLGNPKVDLYRPEFRKPSDRPRERILICAQSQVCNPRGVGFPDLISLHLRGVPMGDDLGREMVEATKEVFAFEISMIPQLQAVARALAAAYPDRAILFRPHPAEDAGLWEHAFKGLANVTVSSEGSMADALADAQVLIYVRGCATGLEAHFQGVPVIRFDGDGRAPEPGNWISSNIGFAAATPGDVIAALRRIEAGDSTAEHDRAVVARSFHSDGDRLVCVGVAAGIAQAAAPHLLPDPSAAPALHALAGVRVALREFDSVKFPPTDVAEVRALAERLARVAGLPMPAITAFADNVFLFTGAPAPENPASAANS